MLPEFHLKSSFFLSFLLDMDGTQVKKKWSNLYRTHKKVIDRSVTSRGKIFMHILSTSCCSVHFHPETQICIHVNVTIMIKTK